MNTRRVRAPHIDFSALRRELELSEQFPLAALHEAALAAHNPLGSTVDRTDIPFVTVDPPGSLDLDQAVCLTRMPAGGYRVQYAIADVACFVTPDGPLNEEAWRRGQTIYFPDAKVPLHPTELSEGAASLLPDQPRRAVVWTLDLDAHGETRTVALERATVRSRAKLDYATVQSDVDNGRAVGSLQLLPEIGKLLQARAIGRGAVNLPMPEQEVEPDGDGWRLTLRAPLPVEDYNAQISLLTGMAAADIMLGGGVGLLRTMPAPVPEAVDHLRTAAQGLGIDWPTQESLGSVLARLDTATPKAAAFVDQAAELLRGAAYTCFDGAPPAAAEHGAVAAPYAHVTAPLRRLADRYATEVCLALHEGREVPEWVRAALPKLPDVMAATDRVAHTAEREAVNLVEAVLLADHVGKDFEATVLDVDHHRDAGLVALDDPPVRARCTGYVTMGDRTAVRLTQADPATRTVLFEKADG